MIKNVTQISNFSRINLNDLKNEWTKNIFVIGIWKFGRKTGNNINILKFMWTYISNTVILLAGGRGHVGFSPPGIWGFS